MGRGNAGGEIRGTGAGSGKAHTHFSGSTGVAVRRVGGTLLMCREHMVDLVLVSVELVIYIQNGAAGIAENRVDLLLQQAFHDGLRCADFQFLFLLLLALRSFRRPFAAR